jgi:hypothetical protein
MFPLLKNRLWSHWLWRCAVSRNVSKTWKIFLELRAAVERNAGKPGVPWKQVKTELDLD